MKLPSDVLEIIDTLNNNNYEAFIVGGAVRDSIIGRVCYDFDIATDALPINIKELFKKTVDTGIKHGTITVIINNKGYEVTTYRIDGEYDDCRRPTEVVFTKKLDQDLLRRDFTINAMAYHPKIGLVDPFLGLEDIQRATIKGVGDPLERFEEDALRLMRCIRFCAKLGFKIEDITYNALLEKAYLIEKISVERIRDELVKIFTAKYLEYVSNVFAESKILKYVNEDLYIYMDKYFMQNISYLQNAINDRLAIFFRFMNPLQLKELMLYLRFSNKEIKETMILVEHINDSLNTIYDIKKLLSHLGEELFFRLLKIKNVLKENVEDIEYNAWTILISKEPITLKDLKINGNILLEKNICPAKNIGQVLNFLLDQVLRDSSNNGAESLLMLARRYYENI